MDIIRVFLTNKFSLGIEVSAWFVVLLVVGAIALLLWKHSIKVHHCVELNIQLGGIGTVKITPTWEDVQIAHRIWTELVTRKAALRIDPEHDVICDIYDSWYALFQRVRTLIGDVPGRCIRREKSTQEIVRIATDTLNVGLRPHLTKWAAKYRNWWEHTSDALKEMTPQEHQKQFPAYSELLSELQEVNSRLIQYANELQKLVNG